MTITKFLLNNMVKNNRLFNWTNICNPLRNGKALSEQVFFRYGLICIIKKKIYYYYYYYYCVRNSDFYV